MSIEPNLVPKASQDVKDDGTTTTTSSNNNGNKNSNNTSMNVKRMPNDNVTASAPGSSVEDKAAVEKALSTTSADPSLPADVKATSVTSSATVNSTKPSSVPASLSTAQSSSPKANAGTISQQQHQPKQNQERSSLPIPLKHTHTSSASSSSTSSIAPVKVGTTTVIGVSVPTLNNATVSSTSVSNTSAVRPMKPLIIPSPIPPTAATLSVASAGTAQVPGYRQSSSSANSTVVPSASLTKGIINNDNGKLNPAVASSSSAVPFQNDKNKNTAIQEQQQVQIDGDGSKTQSLGTADNTKNALNIGTAATTSTTTASIDMSSKITDHASSSDQIQDANNIQKQQQQQLQYQLLEKAQSNLIPHPLINSDMKQIISDILVLLQTYGPLTAYQIEYNLPPYPTLDSLPRPQSSTSDSTSNYRFNVIQDVLDVLTVIHVIHKTNIPKDASSSSKKSKSTAKMTKTTSSSTAGNEAIAINPGTTTLSSIPENNVNNNDETNQTADDKIEMQQQQQEEQQQQQEGKEQEPKMSQNEKIVYFFHDGKVRGDVIYPWEIMDMIQDANAEIDETLDRINLLKKELGVMDDEDNLPKERTPVRSGRKRKVDKLTAESKANEEPVVIAPVVATAIPPSQRMKATREFLKVILLKYPDIVNDPVYNAALRNFNVDLGAVARERERYSNILSIAAGSGASVSGTVKRGSSSPLASAGTGKGTGESIGSASKQGASTGKKRQSSLGQGSATPGKKKRAKKNVSDTAGTAGTPGAAVITKKVKKSETQQSEPVGDLAIKATTDRTPKEGSDPEVTLAAASGIDKSIPPVDLVLGDNKSKSTAEKTKSSEKLEMLNKSQESTTETEGNEKNPKDKSSSPNNKGNALTDVNVALN